MTKLFFVAIFTLAIVSCGQNKTQTNKDEEHINNVCDTIMYAFSNGNFSESFETLKQNTVMPSSTIDTLKVKTTDFANNLFPVYGKIRSYQFISEHKIKDVITKRFYIIKFDKYYLKFAFTLYNNGDKWTISSFEYNEDLIDLLY